MMKKFGLSLKKEENEEKRGPAVKPIASVFNEESDDEKDFTMAERFDKKYAGIKERDKRLIEKTLAEDPTIYQYDEHYEEIERRKNQQLMEQKLADKDKKPKYVNDILKAHKRRELHRLIHDDNVYKKERIEEDGKFDDKEQYITGAYKKQIEEREEFRKQVEIEDKQDEMRNVKDQKLWQYAFQRKMLEDRTRTYADSMPKEELREVKEELEEPRSEMGEVIIKKDSSINGKSSERIQHRDRERGNSYEEKYQHSSSPSRGSTERLEEGHHRRERTKSLSEETKEFEKERSRKQKITEREQEMIEIEEKMAKIFAILRRRNDEESISEARKRYFDRVANGLVIPPIVSQQQQ